MILADTHVVLWLAFEQHRLSNTARKAIDHARKDEDGLAISGITLLEIATLATKGRLHLNSTLETFLEEVEARFVVLPVSGRACARSAELPAAYPKDPADRIIGATAVVQGMALLTADRAIRESKALETIW
ncbi:MAG: type II toxin-antitoxin system VapC family toxin [Candidatus Acidiferrum sp.]